MKRRSGFACLTGCIVAFFASTATGQGSPPPAGSPPGGGPPGGPPSATVVVDCTAGDTIRDALRKPAENLTIEVRGICKEDVVIARNFVTLRGTDPALDGIQGVGPSPLSGDAVVRIEGARAVRIENLSVTSGARDGISAIGSFHVEITNCRLLNNLNNGIFAFDDSSLSITDTVISGSNRGLSVFTADLLTCRRCTIATNASGVVAARGSLVSILESTISARHGVFSQEGGAVFLGDSTLEAVQLGMSAGEHSRITVVRSTFTGALEVGQAGLVELFGSSQVENPMDFNFLDLDSTLRMRDGSRLIGATSVEAFSHLLIHDTSSLEGSLACVTGGDAICDDPSRITGGASGCPRCVTPPP